MDAWGTLLSLAARQYGVVAIRQVEERGLSAAAFRHRAHREGWERLTRAVWSIPGTSLDRRGRLSTALLAAGPNALVTGADGLWLRGVGPTPSDALRLVVSMDRHASRHLSPATKLISSRTLVDADAAQVARLACATAARCFVDLVIPPSPPVHRVRALLIEARQSRVVTDVAVAHALHRARGVPGIAILRRAHLDVLEIGGDSVFSDRVHRRLRADGLRPDPHPAVVATLGRDLHPDITFARARVAIECDSMLAHSGQRDLMVDGRKDRAYRRAAWEPVRLGHLEFDRHWGRFVADLRRVLVG